MRPLTLAALAFAVLAVLLGVWLLSRPREVVSYDSLAPDGSIRASLTFAEWSSHSDAFLLADIEPGASAGASSVPKRFEVVNVSAAPSGEITLYDGPFLSWSPADRAKTAETLRDQGFGVNTEGAAYVPSGDTLSGDPLHSDAGAATETVPLRSRAGLTAVFTRRRSDAQALGMWGTRAIGFPSADGRLVYVAPDAIVVPVSSRP